MTTFHSISTQPEFDRVEAIYDVCREHNNSMSSMAFTYVKLTSRCAAQWLEPRPDVEALLKDSWTVLAGLIVDARRK